MLALPFIEDDNHAILRSVAWSINLKHEGYDNPSWQALYRAFHSPLRAIMQDQDEHSDLAKSFLRTLSLEQTLPFGEIETDFVDDAGDFIKIMNFHDMLTEEEMDREINEIAPTVQIDFVPQSIANAYKDEDMRKQALKASAERMIPMVYSSELYLEDRGYQPPGFDADFAPNDELRAMTIEISATADDLRARIDLEIEVDLGAHGKEETKYRVPFIRAKVQESLEAENYLADLQSLVDKKSHLPNIAMMFINMQHAYCFDLKQAKQVKVPQHVDLAFFIEEYWDELESYDGISTDYTLSETQLAKIADRMLDDLLSVIPDYIPNKGPESSLIRSRSYCEGYILAVQAGASPKDAHNAGYDNWRNWYCEEANVSYHITFTKNAWPKPQDELYDTDEDYRADVEVWAKDMGQALRKAMAAFWTECRKRGLSTPERPAKKIRSIAPRGTGLILQSGRVITWRTAVMIAEAEGFDLTNDRQEKLLAILTKNHWSPKLVEILSS